jgi:hypothetical protein
VGDGELTLLVKDRVFAFLVDLGGKRVGQGVGEGDRAGIVDPEVALAGDVVAGRDQLDPRLPDLPEDRLERGVIAPGCDCVNVAGDQRPVVPDHTLLGAETLIGGHDVAHAEPPGRGPAAYRHRREVRDGRDRVPPVRRSARAGKECCPDSGQ